MYLGGVVTKMCSHLVTVSSPAAVPGTNSPSRTLSQARGSLVTIVLVELVSFAPQIVSGIGAQELGPRTALLLVLWR